MYQNNNNGSDKKLSTDNTKRIDINTHCATNLAKRKVILPTAVIRIQGLDGTYTEFRALVDQGSQATLISEYTVQRLQLPKHKVHAIVSGIGNTKSGIVQNFVEITLKSRFNTSFLCVTKALVLPKLTGYLPSENVISYQNWKHIKTLELADPNFYTSNKIDIILGADVFCQIIQNKIIRGNPGTPIAQKTKFGYILSGEVKKEVPENTINCFIGEADISKELSKFWESEELLPERTTTAEEIECEVHFKSTHTRQKNGTYTVRLPFRPHSNFNELQGSRELALARLFQLERKFKSNKLLEIMYKEFIAEYSQLGHMIPTSEDTERKYYLPHHAVFKHDSSTTKLRVVFDASAKRNSSKSLNDIMMIGENLQQNITEILMRWRKHKVVFTADIEKMYRQIHIDDRDQDFQRILWRNSPNEPIKEYKLTTVTYGTGPAPFLAIRTLRQLVLDDGQLYPLAARAICKDTYMDDVVSGADKYEEAAAASIQLINLLKAGGFNLRKWNSNDSRLLKQIPPELRDCANSKTFDDGEVVKALGIYWIPNSDKLKFNINIQSISEICTKRSILSEAARIFDPIGLLSPVTIKIKLLFQQIWLEETDWDQPVSNNILKEWQKIRDELPSLRKIEICRWIGYGDSIQKCQLHGFSDASEKAYGAVVYLRTITNEGNIIVTLIAAKTKVAPLRSQLSLPRLELNGALLLARLLKEVQRALDVENIENYAWTDSTIVLSWLQSTPNRWKTFVGNRVAEIQALIGPESWYHVSSPSNPADLASRGIYPTKLENNTLWWEGPTWLKQEEFKASKTPISKTNLEIKTKFAVNIVKTEVDTSLVETLLHNYSSLTKLKRILAYCMRFCKNAQSSPENRKTGALTSNEIENSLIILVKVTQLQYFHEEFKQLSKGIPLHKTSRLLSLNPFLDVNHLIRLGGRLSESELSYKQKHPLILPYRSDLTDLIINHAHLHSLHGGNNQTLEYIRQSFWILNSLKAVKGCIYRCTTCHRFKASSASQLMGNLPKPRVTISRPFTNCGVDYAGPFTLKTSVGRGTKTFKGYIALFICLSTKAIHLEVVSNLTSNAFLAAFKRFVSRRGPVANVYSDNATNFCGASKILADLFNQPNYQIEIKNSLSKEGIQWHFIPPASPHFGGLWEAGIKSTKYHMKRIIKDTILSFEELTTLTVKIEACLNSRPLCPLNNDPENLEVLTPGHFLIGAPLLTVPEENVLNENPNLLTRWQLLDQLHQRFWQRWSKEYLSRLQQRPKWTQQQPNLRVGNIVLIREDNLPPTRWLLGRIIETTCDDNGLVRVVTLKTKTSILKRSITKLSLLPIIDNEDNSSYDTTVMVNNDTADTSKNKNETNHLSSKRNHKRSQKEPNTKKIKTSKSTCRSLSSVIFTIILNFFFTMALASKPSDYYSNTQFGNEQGIYFEHIANTNIYSSEWNLIVHFNLSLYKYQTNMLIKSITYLKETCNKFSADIEFEYHCQPIIAQLQHHLEELENANYLIYKQNENLPKKKRAAFGIIGNVAHSLFGVLDEEFAEKYETDISQIKENERHIEALFLRQTSISDSTLNIIKREQMHGNQQYLAMRKQLSSFQDDINRTKQTQALFEKFNSATLVMTLDLSSMRHIQQSILSVITDTRYGRINTLLLTPEQLKTQFKIIREHIPSHLKLPDDQNQILTLYSLMQVKARVTPNNVIFEIKLPLLDAECYQIYQLIPIPLTRANKFIYIQPSSKYLLLNKRQDRYSPMTEIDMKLCRSWKSDNLLCRFNSSTYSLDSNISQCEMELLSSETRLSTFCKLKSSSIDIKWVKMHAANHWIYTLDKESIIDLNCGIHFEKVVLTGNGILRLNPGCTLKHSSMFLSSSQEFTANITSSFLIVSEIPHDILFNYLNSSERMNKDLNNLPTLEGEITSADIQSLHAKINDQRNEIVAVRNINIHDVHHYAMVYIILVLVFVIAICYWLRRYKRVLVTSSTSDPTIKIAESVTTVTSSTPTVVPRQHPFNY